MQFQAGQVIMIYEVGTQLVDDKTNRQCHKMYTVLVSICFSLFMGKPHVTTVIVSKK